MMNPVMTSQSSAHIQDHLWALNKLITSSKHHSSRDLPNFRYCTCNNFIFPFTNKILFWSHLYNMWFQHIPGWLWLFPTSYVEYPNLCTSTPEHHYARIYILLKSMQLSAWMDRLRAYHLICLLTCTYQWDNCSFTDRNSFPKP